MGSGKNGTFDIHPDWQQWAILTVREKEYTGPAEMVTKSLYGNFIAKWFSFFHCETYTFLLQPVEGHGLWDNKKVFGDLSRNSNYTGPIATLTRATIRINKVKAFWQNVDGVAGQMNGAEGFYGSFGIGEIPFLKQATFSLWENKESMQAFAYKMRAHSEVIKKTRSEKWYSEDMFVRFKPIKTFGTIKGKDPFAGKL